MYTIEVRWWDLLRSGEKKYECRLSNEIEDNLFIGKSLIVKSEDGSEFRAKISDLRYYTNFSKAFEDLGQDLVPIEDIYNEFYTDEEVEKYGVIAIGIEIDENSVLDYYTVELSPTARTGFVEPYSKRILYLFGNANLKRVNNIAMKVYHVVKDYSEKFPGSLIGAAEPLAMTDKGLLMERLKDLEYPVDLSMSDIAYRSGLLECLCLFGAGYIPNISFMLDDRNGFVRMSVPNYDRMIRVNDMRVEVESTEELANWIYERQQEYSFYKAYKGECLVEYMRGFNDAYDISGKKEYRDVFQELMEIYFNI